MLQDLQDLHSVRWNDILESVPYRNVPYLYSIAVSQYEKQGQPFCVWPKQVGILGHIWQQGRKHVNNNVVSLN